MIRWIPLRSDAGLWGWTSWAAALVMATGAAAGVRAATEAGRAERWWAALGAAAVPWPPGWAWVEEAGRQVAWGPAPALALGFTVLGAPLVAAVLWVRGYMMGFAAASAVWGTGMPGVAVLIVGVLPAQLAGCAAAALAAGEAVRFGLEVAKAALGCNPHQLPRAFGRFVLAGAAAVLLAVVAGWLGVYGLAAARSLAAPGFR